MQLNLMLKLKLIPPPKSVPASNSVRSLNLVPLPQFEFSISKCTISQVFTYWPISVSNCMYVVLASLMLDVIQQPINAALFNTQAGSCKRYTSWQQAMNLIIMDLHEMPEGSYVCLLDIAAWCNQYTP